MWILFNYHFYCSGWCCCYGNVYTSCNVISTWYLYENLCWYLLDDEGKLWHELNSETFQHFLLIFFSLKFFFKFNFKALITIFKKMPSKKILKDLISHLVSNLFWRKPKKLLSTDFDQKFIHLNESKQPRENNLIQEVTKEFYSLPRCSAYKKVTLKFL